MKVFKVRKGIDKSPTIYGLIIPHLYLVVGLLIGLFMLVLLGFGMLLQKPSWSGFGSILLLAIVGAILIVLFGRYLSKNNRGDKHKFGKQVKTVTNRDILSFLR